MTGISLSATACRFALLAVVSGLFGCARRVDLGGGWVLEERTGAIPESGGFHRNVFRQHFGNSKKIADSISGYHRFGKDCIAFELITVKEEIRGACGDRNVAPLITGGDPGSWKFAEEGVERFLGIQPADGVASEVGWRIPYRVLEVYLRDSAYHASMPVESPSGVVPGVPLEKFARRLAKADLEAEDEYGETKLMRVCTDDVARGLSNDPRSVRALIAAGADVNHGDKYGRTPLILGSDHFEIALMLRNAGAQVNVEDASGWTPLSAAIKAGAVESVQLLLEAEADPCHTNRAGNGPEFELPMARPLTNRDEILSVLSAAKAKRGCEIDKHVLDVMKEGDAERRRNGDGPPTTPE